MNPEPRLARRILVVEDDDATRESFAHALLGEGYCVDSARNGQEALDLLKQGALPDMILLDLAMPVMSGWEFRRRQLDDPALAAIPVLVVSANTQAIECKDLLGEVGYFQKPLDPDVLVSAIKRWTLGFKPTILIIEEDTGVRKMLDVALRYHGFEVMLAASGREAVAIYQREWASISLALVDVQMEDFDGPMTMEVCKTINPDIRFCFMCGSTGKYRTEELTKMGAKHIFMKPFASWRAFVRTLWDTVIPGP